MSSDPNIGLILNQERSDDDEFPGLDDEYVSLQEVMRKWKKDDKEYDKYVAKKYAKKTVTQIIAIGLSHVIPGLGSAMSIPTAINANSRAERLLKLSKESDCPIGKLEECNGILAYAMTQKKTAAKQAAVQTVPYVSTGVSIANKLKNLFKIKQGTAGQARGASAMLLVEHANAGCGIAAAVFVEVVAGDYTQKSNWKDGLARLQSSKAVKYAQRGLSSTG
jgi:hypothetical protein